MKRADKLFQQVVARDDARAHTGFSLHDRDLELLPLHVMEHLRYSSAIGHEMRLPHDFLRLRRPSIFLPAPEIVRSVQNTDDPVERALIYGIGGKDIFGQALFDFLPRLPDLNRDDCVAPCHDLPAGDVVQLEDVLDDAPFVGVDDAVLLALFREDPDLLLGILAVVFRRFEPEQIHDELDGGIQQPDDQGSQAGKDMNGDRGVQGDRFSIPECDLLRHEFAENKRKVRQDDGDQDNAYLVDGFERQTAGFVQPSGQRVGKRVGRECAGEETGERHAKLNGGEETPGIGRKLTENPSALSAFLEFLHHDGFQGDQRHFGGREKSVQDDQDDQEKKLGNQGGIGGIVSGCRREIRDTEK